jgi:YesN/AraC family two-component response regulator
MNNRAIISKPFTDVMQINPTLLQHKHELLNQESSDIIVFPTLMDHSESGFSNLKEQQLLESIVLCNHSQCLSLSKDYVQHLKAQDLDVSEIKFQLYGMLSYIIKSINCDDNTRGLLNNLLLSYTKTIDRVINTNSLYSCFIDQLISISQLLEQSELSNQSSVIQTLCQYIDNHYQEDITLSSLCDEVHMNSQYISKLFKEVKGITYSDYLTDTRMYQAKKLLAHSNQTIQEISSLVGYNDPNYFTRAFKKHESISPKAYRQKSNIYHDQS